jgi:predicted SprT family Zn-dependent metalloprotease
MARARTQQITREEYAGFDGAYEWFNHKLFGGKLPPCLNTLQRKAHSHGYFANERIGHRSDEEERTDELALHPDTFVGRSDKDILSTLVHEMCHCWQQHFGKPSCTGYHNTQWAAKMIEVGLMPPDTGLEGGKQTGQRMTHYIVEGGMFAVAADALLATKFRLNWQSAAWGERPRPKGKNKVKYTCPACGQNAWAKPEASLVCGECEEEMEAKDNGLGYTPRASRGYSRMAQRTEIRVGQRLIRWDGTRGYVVLK